MKVLLVDDHVDALDALAMRAETLGHEVHKAYESGAALALAKAHRFDLILMDIDLGAGDGRKICAEIRRDGLSRDAHIVAITGYVELQQTLSLGDFNGYVLKPLEFERLEDFLTS